MDTLNYIFDRWKLDRSSKFVRMLGYSRQGTLTRLFKNLGFQLGCEVGVERGRFAKILCNVIPGLKLYGVDPWEFTKGYREHIPQEELNDFLKVAKGRMSSYNFQIVRDFSVNAAKRFNDETFDFVYIDAIHSYENVKEDILSWHPKVKKGGIISGHDYSDGLDSDRQNNPTYGVKQAVNEWVEKNKISHLFILEKEGDVPSWFYVKE